MSKTEKGHIGERPKTAREDRDNLFSELETKLLAVARSFGGASLSSRAAKAIETIIDDYFKRWKA
jgi:hypothetical protein